MSPREILDRLDQQFRLLTGGSRVALERHQTLRAAIHWSYDLLTQDEQTLLNHCAVFVGGFDLASAAALAEPLGMDDLDVVDGIGSLVAKSLVERAEQGASTRYRMLEMIRQYASEKLDAAGEATVARDLHARHYLGLTRTEFERALTSSAWDALDVLELETPNVAAAGNWHLGSGRIAELLEFFHELPFVDSTTLPATTVDALGRLAAEAVDDPTAVSLRGAHEACVMAAMRHFLDGNTPEYHRFSEFGTSLPGPRSARVLVLASSAAMFNGAVSEAIAVGTEAVDLARTTAVDEELAFALAILAVYEQFESTEAATDHAAEGVAIARVTRSPLPLLYPLLALAMALREVDPDRASAAADECIRLDRSQRRTWSAACESVAATLRFAHGDLVGGYKIVRNTLTHLAHAGDRAMLSATLLQLGEAIAQIEPSLALRFLALYQSDAIAAWGGFEYQPKIAELARRNADELDAAQSPPRR